MYRMFMMIVCMLWWLSSRNAWNHVKASSMLCKFPSAEIQKLTLTSLRMKFVLLPWSCAMRQLMLSSLWPSSKLQLSHHLVVFQRCRIVIDFASYSIWTKWHMFYKKLWLTWSKISGNSHADNSPGAGDNLLFNLKPVFNTVGQSIRFESFQCIWKVLRCKGYYSPKHDKSTYTALQLRRSSCTDMHQSTTDSYAYLALKIQVWRM